MNIQNQNLKFRDLNLIPPFKDKVKFYLKFEQLTSETKKR